MKKRYAHAVWAGLAVLTMATVYQADAAIIDFDSPPTGLVPNSTFIAGSAVDADAQVTNQFENLGAIITTLGGAPYAALIDLGVGHAVSGANGIGAVNSSGDLDYALTTDIFLVVPGTLTPAVTDQISLSGDEIPSFGQVFYSAYDLNGNLVASGQTTDTGGTVFSLSAAGIHEFRVSSQNGDVALDNLTFDTPSAPTGPTPTGSTVPEPSGIGLLGLPALAGIAWKRRRSARKSLVD
jgi:hypothetical protein